MQAMLLATFFAGSGLLTFQIYHLASKTGNDALQFVPGLPFAAACSFRFMRPRVRAFLGLLLSCGMWVVAFRIGTVFSMKMEPVAALAIAGLVGALGVTAATGIGCRSLYSRTSLLGAAILGAITGAPFGLIPGNSQQENLILALSFPLWQVAIGLWLWRRCATTES